MRNLTISFTLMTLLLLVGCGKFDVMNNPAEGIMDAPRICIIDNPQTREGFRTAMENWLTQERIPYKILPMNSDAGDCDWALSYYGLWSWDMAIFLSNAEITAYHGGKEVGKEKLIVGQWDSYKFEDGEARIHKLMDMLFSKTDHYPLPNSKHDTK